MAFFIPTFEQLSELNSFADIANFVGMQKAPFDAMLELFGIGLEDHLSCLAEVTAQQIDKELDGLTWQVDGAAVRIRIRERGQAGRLARVCRWKCGVEQLPGYDKEPASSTTLPTSTGPAPGTPSLGRPPIPPAPSAAEPARCRSQARS